MFITFPRGVSDAGRPLRVRVLAGLAGISLVGAGTLAYGPLSSSALAAEPTPSTPPACGQAPTSPVPTFFTDEAAQPPVAAPDSANHYTLTAHQGTHSFHSGWPAVPTLGYSTANATVNYLGPTIVTSEGTPVDVTITNALPAAGTAMFPQFGYPNNANDVVLHRHGGLQPALSDGAPDQLVAPGASRTNHYPNDQAAAPLWYHDHADAVTSFNVYAGLAGFSPNTDTLEPGFNLPGGDFSRAYVLQDKSFNSDHSLCYTHDSPEFFGDLPVVNGTIAPRQSVEPRRYTFTFINGSDSRFYHLSLTPTGETEGPAPQMTVVGSDSGYLLHPSRVSSQLIAPGERYKIVVDFTGRTGQWVLSNDAATPFPDGDETVATIPSLMRFDVGTTVTGQDTSSIPATITETNNVEPPQALLAQARLRTVQAGELSPGVPQLGDAAGLQTFTDPATETPQLGSTEAWAMQNHSPDAHPIHEHLVELRLVGRWPVVWDPNTLATGHPVAQSIGAFQPPGAFESGPKDTYVAPTDFITVWIGQYTVGGQSVWHCHILSHEDSSIVEMMRPLVVGAAAQTQLPVIGSSNRLDQLVRQGAGTAAVTRLSDFNRDANTDLVARDTTGRLWLYPGNGAGGFLPRFLMSGGWNNMTALVTPGDVTGDGNADVLARDTAGRLWLYPGNGRLGLSARRQIGAGWNGYTLTDAANMNGSGRPDLLARDTAGVLWLYPLSGNAVFGPRTRIGAGWNGFTFRGPGDVTGDGKADILARDPVGSLWIYRGNGAGAVGGRSFVGGGWQSMTALDTPGNWDTVAGNDLLSRDPSGRLWFYPGNDASGLFSRHQIGAGWNSMTFIG